MYKRFVGIMCLITKRNQTLSLSLATTVIVYLFVKRVSEVWKDTVIPFRPGDDRLDFRPHPAQNMSSLQEDESAYDDPCVFFLMEHVDSSVECMDQEWLCDEYADYSDIICKWYKSQSQNQVDGSCLLPNATEVGFQNGGSPVPRIVYYVAFGLGRLSFIQYLSMLSAKRFIKPWAMYVVGDVHPTGTWWQTATTDLGARFIQRDRPGWLADRKITSTELAGHLIRLQLLMVNGGIYLDLDMLILRPLDPLLRYDVTLGHHDNDRGLNNAVILAKKHAAFIEKWYIRYNDFHDDDFTTLAEINVRQLSNEHPSSVHMETRNFLFPDKSQMRVLSINHSYDWRENYGIHLPWHQLYRLPTNPDGIDKMRNSTVRQILKYVYDEKRAILTSP